jgi:hypothetical protein
MSSDQTFYPKSEFDPMITYYLNGINTLISNVKFAVELVQNSCSHKKYYQCKTTESKPSFFGRICTTCGYTEIYNNFGSKERVVSNKDRKIKNGKAVKITIDVFTEYDISKFLDNDRLKNFLTASGALANQTYSIPKVNFNLVEELGCVTKQLNLK